MSRVKAVALSIGDAMVFASYTVGPIVVFLFAIGFLELNI